MVQVWHHRKSKSILQFCLKQNVNSFFIKKGTFSCQIKGKTAKILMKTFFVVTTARLLIHYFLCFHEVRTVDFIHQHPVDFLLHRLSCVLTIMESDNISCLPNPFCKCIVFRFRIHNLSHKLLLSCDLLAGRVADWSAKLPNCLPVFCSFARQREDSYYPDLEFCFCVNVNKALETFNKIISLSKSSLL